MWQGKAYIGSDPMEIHALVRYPLEELLYDELRIARGLGRTSLYQLARSRYLSRV